MRTKFAFGYTKGQLYRICESLRTEGKQIFMVDGQLRFIVMLEWIWVTDGHEDVEYAVEDDGGGRS